MENGCRRIDLTVIQSDDQHRTGRPFTHRNSFDIMCLSSIDWFIGPVISRGCDTKQAPVTHGGAAVSRALAQQILAREQLTLGNRTRRYQTLAGNRQVFQFRVQ
jgi:hypothetical protein